MWVNFYIRKSLEGFKCTSWSVLFDKLNYLQGLYKNILTCGTIFLHPNKFTQIALLDILEKVDLFTKNPIK